MPTLTATSHATFVAYALDAGNWSGMPLVGGNVESTAETRGNLTDLKRKGLISTFSEDGDVWVCFTSEGYEYAKAHGIVIGC